MPNATVRANARALPEESDSLSEINSRNQAFSRAQARWHRAVAQMEVPDREDDEYLRGVDDEERAALLALLVTPASCSEAFWAKLAAFEEEFIKEKVIGEHKDSVLLLGLGAIKADLMNLSIGRAA